MNRVVSAGGGPARRRRRSGLMFTLLASLVLTALVTLGDDHGADAIVLGRRLDVATAGPLGPVTVVGDSVLLGSALYEPTLPDRLAAQGWGPIRFVAGVGYKAGPPGDSTTAGWWIEQWRREGWDALNVIVNLGANDSGICGTELACSRRRILAVVDTIGRGRSIWWPMITRLQGYEHQAATWNLALRQIAAERSDVHTWDWPTEIATGGYRSTDNTHLDPAGYRQRSARMAAEFTSTIATARRLGDDAPLPTPIGEASTYVPLVPRRIVDTRIDPPGRLGPGSTVRVDFGDALPAGTTAVAINATAARPGGAGYLAAGPCGQPIDGSTVNYDATGARAAMAVVPVGTGGDVCIRTRTATDVVVDLQGAFVAGSDGDGFTSLASARRLLDTRDTGRSRRLVVEAPAAATAVAVNLTVTGAAASGWLRAAPCGVATGVSNVNFRAGEPVAGAAYVPTSAAGTICVETNVPAGDRDLIGAVVRPRAAHPPARHAQRKRRLGTRARRAPDDRHPRRPGGRRGRHRHDHDGATVEPRPPGGPSVRCAAADLVGQCIGRFGAGELAHHGRVVVGPSLHLRRICHPDGARRHRLVDPLTPPGPAGRQTPRNLPRS